MGKDLKVEYPIDDQMADYGEDRCPILYALDIVGQKWKLPILWYLHEAKATRYQMATTRKRDSLRFSRTWLHGLTRAGRGCTSRQIGNY